MDKEIKKLYEIGFAVHLLHKNSKRPIHSGWTKGPKTKLEKILSEYRPGMNIGVRLGRVSEISKKFLCVIDCDVKSPDHKNEMVEKLNSIFPPALLKSAPRVRTGRGNGSMHFYMVTKEPATPGVLFKSGEIVKVKMPSSERPSKKELAELTKEEIESGIRLRPAFEIAIMGEGQQVVLPPSIHPDTRKAYEWVNAQNLSKIPTLDLGDVKAAEIKTVEKLKTELVDLENKDLRAFGLPEYTVDLIEKGVGCSGDRSASLFKVTCVMAKQGLSNSEIVSILTDKKNYLGEVAFDHAKTSSRVKAAEWLLRYTVPKCRNEVSAEKDFKDNVEIELLPEAEAKEVHAEAVKPLDWRDKIERTDVRAGAKPKVTAKNVRLILENDETIPQPIFKLNEFADAEIYGADAPWKGKAGDELRNVDLVRIKMWLSHKYRFEPGTEKIVEAITSIADHNRFHPVRDYIDTLKWDGKKRISTWLKRHLNAKAPEPYLSEVSKKILVAMVARVYEPGRKFDQVLILEGDQGFGKSTAVRHLASNAWFSDTHINIADKDAVLAMRSVWIVELGELSSLRKADVDHLKEFISRTTDRIRVPYGRKTENFPRQCIFIGTTNREEFLRDDTGNRRFWPVEVGEYDFESIKAERDQLFAEAKAAYDLGETLFLDNKKAAEIAKELQQDKLVHDVWVDRLKEFFKGEMKKPKNERFDDSLFPMSRLFSPGGPFQDVKDGQFEQKRIASGLRVLGYQSKVFKKDGVTQRLWFSKKHHHAFGEKGYTSYT